MRQEQADEDEDTDMAHNAGGGVNITNSMAELADLEIEG